MVFKGPLQLKLFPWFYDFVKNYYVIQFLTLEELKFEVRDPLRQKLSNKTEPVHF